MDAWSTNIIRFSPKSHEILRQNAWVVDKVLNLAYRTVPTNRTATTPIKRQLISSDSSYQFDEATTHIIT